MKRMLFGIATAMLGTMMYVVLGMALAGAG
jgi:hypothetical protein